MNKLNTQFLFYDIILAAITWIALIIQIFITQNIANTFSYFTILTNLLIAISLTVSTILPHSRLGHFFSNVSLQSSLSSYIIIVCLIYNFVIRSSWSQPIPEFISDNILHIITPVFYGLRWVIYIPKGTLKWNDSFKWLLFPSVYLIYSLARGSITHWYPYLFVDLTKNTTFEVIRNILMILLFILIIGLILTLTDFLINRRQAK